MAWVVAAVGRWRRPPRNSVKGNMRRTIAVTLLLFVATCLCDADARRRDPKALMVEQPGTLGGGGKQHKSGGGGGKGHAAAAAAALTPTPSDPVSAGQFAHGFLAVLHAALLLYCMLLGSSADRPAAFRRASASLAAIFALEAAAHGLSPLPHLSVGVMIFVAVVFTINPIEDEARPIGLHMGSVPILCVLWLGATGVMSYADFVRAIYGTDALRPYHLIVMFLGSVYLCTALERSGFLHTAALKVVERYGRSPWGLFWALSCFSATLTVLIPDDIVTMTLTPITIRMCQLLNLPEIPYLFAQFFAGNIWAVTLVTGNPTNVLLAEDLGDSFVSFAGRMGIPGSASAGPYRPWSLYKPLTPPQTLRAYTGRSLAVGTGRACARAARSHTRARAAHSHTRARAARAHTRTRAARAHTRTPLNEPPLYPHPTS